MIGRAIMRDSAQAHDHPDAREVIAGLQVALRIALAENHTLDFRRA
jgi:hypothetical protein